MSDADQLLTLSGHAALTGSWYDVGGKFQELLVPGCFRRNLAENRDVVLLLGHGDAGSGLPLARTRAGSLTLTEDERGLHFSASLDPNDPDSELVARKLARGDLDGQCSFAFQAAEQSWSADYAQRRVIVATLHKGDVSIVTQGANDRTFAAIGTRSAVLPARVRYVPDLATRYRLRLMVQSPLRTVRR